MKPCLFLDRDGVIIHNVPYTRNPDDIKLMSGITQLMQKARNLGYLIVVVTNQSGIGRGLLSENDYHILTSRMLQLLQPYSLHFDQIYFAPYYEAAKNPEHLKKPDWRKPAPGMILQACQDFSIDLSRSVLIGDRASDMQAAENAKVARKILFKGEDFASEVLLVPSGIKFEIAEDLGQISL